MNPVFTVMLLPLMFVITFYSFMITIEIPEHVYYYHMIG
jgi:hypothetical protein